MMGDPYAYEPLKGSSKPLRIATLQSASDRTSSVHLAIASTDLNQVPRYSALSYVWGDNTEEFPIFINGKKFLVNENLFQALQHLRANFGKAEPLPL